MPLLTDGDIIKGWIRERKLLKRIYESTFIRRSEVFRRYVQGVSKVTGLPEDTVLKSQPVRNFLKRLIG